MTTEHAGSDDLGQEPEVQLALDGRPHRVRRGTTLAVLVGDLGHEPGRVTTAVNGQFVRRDQRAGCVLGAGDAVLLFQPIVGG